MQMIESWIFKIFLAGSCDLRLLRLVHPESIEQLVVVGQRMEEEEEGEVEEEVGWRQNPGKIKASGNVFLFSKENGRNTPQKLCLFNKIFTPTQ